MKTVLAIAGSDSGAGAGIQADIKTMMANGVYATTVITAITAQNTMGVASVMEATADIVSKQLDCIFTDIYPDAVKIGMVYSSDIIDVIAKKLKQYKASNIVIDTIMKSTSKTDLIKSSAREELCKRLFPLAEVITPNIDEAEELAKITISSPEDMYKAAAIIYEKYGCKVIVKGGHCKESADDLVYIGNDEIWIRGNLLHSMNTHGTGCTYSSALACGLAKGYNLVESAKEAKKYMNYLLNNKINLGKGNGPLNHGYYVDD